ncbi:hypothetical protein [Nostoc sp.]
MRIAVETFLFCGLSVRDDAIERQNIAASCDISGALKMVVHGLVEQQLTQFYRQRCDANL